MGLHDVAGVRAATEPAIRRRFLGPLTELCAMQRATDRFDTGAAKMLTEVRAALIGSPASVHPTDARVRFWMAAHVPVSASGSAAAPVAG